MAEVYDIVAVGGGHHGLIAAAYMAKAGKKVLVLERNDHIGGGAVTKELAPGFRYDEHSTVHAPILDNPMLKKDELGLKSKFGLEYVYPDPPLATLFDDGSMIVSYRDVEEAARSIAQFSRADAESYRRFVEYSMRVSPMLVGGLFAPAVPMSTTVTMLSQSPEGKDLLLMWLKSGLDIIKEWFTHEKVLMHFAKLMTENLAAPDEKGTGAMGAMAFVAGIHTTGFGLPKGGSGSLAEALRRCIEHYGGKVLINRHVSGIVRSGKRATGVRTADGSQYAAKDAVIGAIHPHHLRRYFPDVDDGVLRRAEAVQMAEFSAMTMHFALHEPIRFKGHSADAGGAMFVELVPSKLETLRRAFDEYRYGRWLNPIPHFSLTRQSVFDPTRAPPGKSLMMALTYAPYDLAEGGAQAWDTIRGVWTRQVVQSLGAWVTNLDPDNIIASTSYSPLDLERSSPSFVRGDIHGAAPFFHQMNGHRPTPDLAQYKVPGIEGFYLVGPFMHPGAGLTGAGRATAVRMMEDLKIDFAKAIAR